MYCKMFKSNRENVEIFPGSLYRHTGKGQVVETAKVIAVGPDKQGIPHVRFEVSITRPSSRFFNDSRLLALNSFSRRYPERVSA
jgi:hypothetical protein